MEYHGHLEGMLDRDQRTAKLRFFNSSDNESAVRTCGLQERAIGGAATPAVHHCCHPVRTRRGPRSSCRSVHLLNTVQSVKNLLAVVCIIAVTLPRVNSAPVSMEESWVKPCNETAIINNSEDLTPIDVPPAGFDKLSNQAQMAREQANDTLNAYVTTIIKDNNSIATFNKQPKPDWLPSLPNTMDNLEVDKALSDFYNYLQRAAVGLDLAIRTWNEMDTLLVEKFKEAIHQSRAVLCELFEITINSNRSPPEDVHRDIVSDQDKQVSDATHLRVRNYIILKNYLDTLDYVINASTHLKK